MDSRIFPYATSAQLTTLVVLWVSSVILFAEMMVLLVAGTDISFARIVITTALVIAAAGYHERLTGSDDKRPYDWAVDGL